MGLWLEEEGDSFQIEFSMKNLIHYLPPHITHSQLPKTPNQNQPILLIQGKKINISQLQLLDLENVIVILHGSSSLVISDHQLPQRECISL